MARHVHTSETKVPRSSSSSRPSVALIDAAYAPSTTTKYSSHANRFYDWLLQHGHRPSSFINLDKLLVIYLQELYDTGMGKAAANATVFGLNVAQPGVTDHLPAAKKALKGFNKLVPSRQHPPLTWPITCVIALEMIRRGHFNEGVVTLLAFDCYLRINEALGLYREDVALGADVRIGMGRLIVYICDCDARKRGPNKVLKSSMEMLKH